MAPAWPYSLLTNKQDRDGSTGWPGIGIELVEFSEATEHGQMAVDAENWLAYFEQMCLLPLQTIGPKILVVDRFWSYLSGLSDQAALRFSTRLFHLFRVLRKYNAEIWLLDDGEMYNRNLNKSEAVQSLLANTDHLYQLDHRKFTNRLPQKMQPLLPLSDHELDLLTTLNRVKDPRLDSYREVFVRSNAQPATVYGIVASEQERSIIN